MNEIIDELNRNVQSITIINEQDETNLNLLVEKYKLTQSQKERQLLMKNIYDLKRKILKNKMLLLSYQERIDYINIKGKDVPEEYKVIEFTNDNYQQINTENISSQTKLTSSNRFLSGLFKKDLFSPQNSHDKKCDELNKKVVILNSYAACTKELFESLLSNLKECLSQINNMTDNQILLASRRYLESVAFDLDKYNLPKEYKRDLNIIKRNYIDLLTAELKVYIPYRDKINLSEIKFLSSQTRFINHLNIFLNKFMEHQIEKFYLEDEQIKLNIKGKQIYLLDNLTYLDTLDIEYEKKENHLHR